ncbi:hypothetical protein H4O18_05105 [Arenibacter sp. BSSL-BM3]|uniref:Uncharacterized protein n=1 Tax=Arenibacter arenosicollis TaxID=2762274 RepID=A0ABR7QJM7_9FLAO|nr:hypothetical protein [Arenibacter arenosicollis]MBC8767364.1 hypothetical protein [Arenibacter arenosicollis]
MTAQIKERLLIDGEEYGMATEPLAVYLQELQPKPKLILFSTACWRGYIGSWELINNRLYLVDFSGKIEDEKIVDVGLDYLFPGKKRVFAQWFSGTIRVPHGKVIKYVHADYLTEYEDEFLLKFKEGSLIDIKKKGV